MASFATTKLIESVSFKWKLFPVAKSLKGLNAHWRKERRKRLTVYSSWLCVSATVYEMMDLYCTHSIRIALGSRNCLRSLIVSATPNTIRILYFVFIQNRRDPVIRLLDRYLCQSCRKIRRNFPGSISLLDLSYRIKCDSIRRRVFSSRFCAIAVWRGRHVVDWMLVNVKT